MVGDIFTVEVTEEDIKNGVRCSTTECPIAKAIKRTTTGEWFYVSGCLVMFNVEGTRAIKVVESDENNFINFIGDFDDKKKVNPLSIRFQEMNANGYKYMGMRVD